MGCPRLWAAVMAVVCLGVPGRSQNTESFTSIRGELHSEAPVYFKDFRVELADLDLHNAYRADVQSDGSFQVHDVPSGSYYLRVTTLRGDAVHQEWVNVAQHAGPLSVRLPVVAKAFAAGTVSVNHLRHPPARKAIEAAASAHFILWSILARDPGTRAEGIRHLERAAETLPAAREALERLRAAR